MSVRSVVPHAKAKPCYTECRGREETLSASRGRQGRAIGACGELGDRWSGLEQSRTVRVQGGRALLSDGTWTIEVSLQATE